MIVQDVEALAARATDVEVIDELIDDVLQRRKIPSAAANALEGLVVNLALADAVTVRLGEILREVFLRRREVGLVPRREPPLGAIRIVPTRIRPEDDRRACVEE